VKGIDDKKERKALERAAGMGIANDIIEQNATVRRAVWMVK